MCARVNKASIDLVTNIIQNNIFKHINISLHMIEPYAENENEFGISKTQKNIIHQWFSFFLLGESFPFRIFTFAEMIRHINVKHK